MGAPTVAAMNTLTTTPTGPVDLLARLSSAGEKGPQRRAEAFDWAADIILAEAEADARLSLSLYADALR